MPKTISIIITTYGTQSFYTQACLESIRAWKNFHHEVIVVVHDESPLLRAYLDACVSDKLIDKLIFAVSGHGHTRGFNLGLQYATGDVVFNICNDILIGPSLVDHCAWDLRHDKQLGMIGWHWYSEGATWQDGRLKSYILRDSKDPYLSKEHEENIRRAHWFTGRYFEGIGGPLWIHLCNTSFFGMRRDLLELIGGFAKEYPHYWADDFLSYAVLDQGLDVRYFDSAFRNKAYFHEFQYDNLDSQDRRRNDDCINFNEEFLKTTKLIRGGGLSENEAIYLYLLAKNIPNDSVVTNVGVWRGESAVILLDALKGKVVKFNFIDCFDIPGISTVYCPGDMSHPVTVNDFRKIIQLYIGSGHSINIIKADTLSLNQFPKSDLIFIDAGHTQECAMHDANLAKSCLSDNGVVIFHDYGFPFWPAVKSTVDGLFDDVEIYETLAVCRGRPQRHKYSYKVQ